MKPSDERIIELNHGRIETKNLMDALCVNIPFLVNHILPDVPVFDFPPKTGITKKMKMAAEAVYTKLEWQGFERLCKHPADTPRGIACYIIDLHPHSLEEKFNHVRALAADSHFGVREWAWASLRNAAIAELTETLGIMEEWSLDADDNIRRYASEMTRPRGVWCPHIRALREEPWRGEVILNNLRDDPARYVQLSVGNWLNDAGKDHPDWVKDLCLMWQANSNSLNTMKICKRALRNLK